MRRGGLGDLLGWTVFFVLAVVLVLNAALWWSYRRFGAELDRQLGDRLLALAVTASAALDPDDVESAYSASPDAQAPAAPLAPVLDRILEDNDLSNVTLLRSDETTLADLRGITRPGERNPTLDLDLVAVTSALAGRPAYSRQYQVEGTYLKSAYAPVRNTKGETVGAVAVEAGASYFAAIRDVRRNLLLAAGLSILTVALAATGFVQAARSLTSLEESLRRSENLATMGQMAAMMAHEIRNPLGIIKGAAERLRERYGLKDDEIYNFIPGEVDRLNDILGNYLRFARGDLDVTGVFRADQVVENTVALVAHDLARRGSKLTVDIDDSARGSFSGEGQGLRQALLNLVLNAAQAVEREAEIRLSVRLKQGRLQFEVADNGPGIPPEIRKKLGQPFFTTRPAGSGLGLAIVNRVAENHGGRLLVTSRPGEGSVFVIDLPAHRAPDSGEAT